MMTAPTRSSMSLRRARSSSVAASKIQSCRLSPPSPNGRSRLSLGPVTYPSSETEMSQITAATGVLCDGASARNVDVGGDAVGPGGTRDEFERQRSIVPPQQRHPVAERNRVDVDAVLVDHTVGGERASEAGSAEDDDVLARLALERGDLLLGRPVADARVAPCEISQRAGEDDLRERVHELTCRALRSGPRTRHVRGCVPAEHQHVGLAEQLSHRTLAVTAVQFAAAERVHRSVTTSGEAIQRHRHVQDEPALWRATAHGSHACTGWRWIIVASRRRPIVNRSVQHNETLDRTFFALSDPTRRKILERLTDGPATIGELAEPFGLTLNGLKKHVGLLETVDLVVTEKVGRARECRLGPAQLDDATGWIEGYRQVWERRLDRFGAFVEDGQ